MPIDPDFDMIDFFDQTEESVRQQTLGGFANVHNEIVCAVDLLVKQGEFIVENIDPISNDGNFQFLASLSFYRCPYTLKSVDYLWLRGYYTEAMVLVRHLYESYAAVRYFHEHRDRILTHLTATRSKDRVRFIDMFDHIAPGFYHRFYGQMSSFAHGGPITAAMRTKHEASGVPGTVIVGLEFNVETASVVGEYYTLNIIYAFLQHANTFFPTHRDRASAQLLTELDQLRDRLRAQIDDPRTHSDFEADHRNIMIPFLTN